MSEPIDVLMLAVNDWANTGFRFARCLRMLGLKVLYFKGYDHPFLYPEQGLIHPALKVADRQDSTHVFYATKNDITGLKREIEASRVVHYIASLFLNPTDTDITKKKVVAQHGGTTYRTNTKQFNEIYNPIVSHTIIQCPDLLERGAKNEKWILYPVDTDTIRPVYHNRDFLVVSHFPTSAETKGSAKIMGSLKKLYNNPKHRGKWKFYGNVGESEKRSIWYAQLASIAECDVYIEACQPTLDGIPYGAWGNAALEAAALGKIVITHSLYEDKYKAEYGEHPMLICNTPDEIEDTLDKLLSMKLTDVRKLQAAHRAWAVRQHSMRVTAKRIWEQGYNELFPEKENQIKEALTHHESPRETICDTLRSVYKLTEKAMGQAKAMNDKLTDYQHDWYEGMFKEKET